MFVSLRVYLKQNGPTNGGGPTPTERQTASVEGPKRQMDDSQATRFSLLVRLRDMRDAEAWFEFVEIYTPGARPEPASDGVTDNPRMPAAPASRCPGFGSPWYLIETGMATAHNLRPTVIILPLNDCTYRAAWSADMVPSSAGSTAVADGGTSLKSRGSQSVKVHSQTRYWSPFGLSESLIFWSLPDITRRRLPRVSGIARLTAKAALKAKTGKSARFALDTRAFV